MQVYRCDVCHQISEPFAVNWREISRVGTHQTYEMSERTIEHICSDCWDRMKAAVGA